MWNIPKLMGRHKRPTRSSWGSWGKSLVDWRVYGQRKSRAYYGVTIARPSPQRKRLHTNSHTGLMLWHSLNSGKHRGEEQTSMNRPMMITFESSWTWYKRCVKKPWFEKKQQSLEQLGDITPKYVKGPSKEVIWCGGKLEKPVGTTRKRAN